MWMCLRSEFSLIPFPDRAKQHNTKADFFYSAPLHCQAEPCWAEPASEQLLQEKQHKKGLSSYAAVQRFALPDFNQALSAHKQDPQRGFIQQQQPWSRGDSLRRGRKENWVGCSRENFWPDSPPTLLIPHTPSLTGNF